MHDFGVSIHWLRNTYLTVLCCLIWSVMGTDGAEYRQSHDKHYHGSQDKQYHGVPKDLEVVYILAVLNGRRSWNISLWHRHFTVVICMAWSVVRTHGAEYRQLHTSTGNKLGTDGGKAIGKAFEVNTSRQVCAKAS